MKVLTTILLSLVPLAVATPTKNQHSNAASILSDILIGTPKQSSRNAAQPVTQEVHSDLVQRQFSPSTASCYDACVEMAIKYPHLYMTNSNSSDFVPLPYWSVQQAEVVPACRIDATSAQDISAGLLAAESYQCPWAVKSGGHAAFAGASSIQGGILINFAKLNYVNPSADRTVTSVGTGATWFDVYSHLDPLGLSVVGGREAGIGVGGLVLGGGISYFSGRFGWACDNIISYEIILADGQIVNATANSYPDLYWALRGGSGVNFGLIAGFELSTFEQGQMWGGMRLYRPGVLSPIVNMFYNFVNNAPTDELAHLYISYVYAAPLNSYIAITGPTYSLPNSNPAIFKELNAIPPMLDFTNVTTMASLSVLLNQTTTYSRELWRTITFKNDATIIQNIITMFEEEANTILNVQGFFPAVAFQPLSTNILNHMQKNGGNALGLSAADGPLVILNINWSWSNMKDDDLVLATAEKFITRSLELAESVGKSSRFIYMNYAGQDQDVFAGYGPESVSRLKAVQAKYDPKGTFARLQPGYFKLDDTQ